MHLTTEEKHQDSLNLLSEVKTFMEQWPPHPSMREMIDKIDGHLSDPTNRLVAQHNQKRTASSITPKGRRHRGQPLTERVEVVKKRLKASFSFAQLSCLWVP